MGKLQENPAVKLLAATAFLILTFFAASAGFRVLSALPYMETDNWQETSRFSSLLYHRQEELAAGAAWTLALAEGELTYVEQQQTEENLELLYGKMDPSATWFRFRILSSDGTEVLASNLAEGEPLNETVSAVHYAAFQPGEYHVEREMDHYGSYLSNTPSAALERAIPSNFPSQLIIECGVPSAIPADSPVEDEFSRLAADYTGGRSNFSQYTNSCLLFSALACACLLFLLWSAGHRAGFPGIVLTWQEQVFFEFYLAAMASLSLFSVYGIVELGGYLLNAAHHQEPVNSSLPATANSLASAFVLLLTLAVALTLRTLTVRLKAGAMARTTLLCRVFLWIFNTVRELLHAVPFLWRSMALFVLYCILNAVLFERAHYDGWAALGWWVVNGTALLLLCRWAIGFHHLRKGGQAIASGNLSYQIDTRRMAHDLKQHAQDLNNISQGLAGAVEEKMKSERFKAELITNVSHDLKTPLTSIINYVNLLKTTEQTDPKAAEYIEVLDRKSQRLKKLTEDLVEASKASTGVLSVSREKIGMAQLLDQALGEWTEKLEARNLALVPIVPEGETWVYADGRHLWRVMDNLLSNCAKYAMEGTRIYLELNRGKGQVSLSVKNISREPLNVPPEQLMERFVRGEESRTTEGSGLGLSIARSLTELQGGEFSLTVDGDLFKATVTLPQAN